MVDRPGGVAAIILAAGSGQRMGADKLLLPVGGEPMVVRSLAPYLACSDLTDIVVVVRPGARWPGEQGRLRLVENPFHSEGMGASLRVGAAALPDDLEAIVLGLGDLPWLGAGTVSAAISAWRRTGGVLVPTHAGRRGHPVVVPGHVRGALCEAHGDVGARGVLCGVAERVTRWETTDPGAVTDVDTPDDLPLAAAGVA